MGTTIQQLKNILAEIEKEYASFYDKKNNAAGTRLRKHCHLAIAVMKEIRVDVSKIKVENKAAKS